MKGRHQRPTTIKKHTMYSASLLIRKIHSSMLISGSAVLPNDEVTSIFLTLRTYEVTTKDVTGNNYCVLESSPPVQTERQKLKIKSLQILEMNETTFIDLNSEIKFSTEEYFI